MTVIRDKLGRLLPGSKLATGNTNPRLPEEFRLKCVEAATRDVFPAWVAEVQAQGEHWVECSKMLAAYGFGKPRQDVSAVVDVVAHHTAEPLTQAERRQLLAVQLTKELEDGKS